MSATNDLGRKLVVPIQRPIPCVKNGPAQWAQTFTLTFGDQAENHVGMQKIGTLASSGFSKEDLEKANTWFQEKGAVCEMIDLSETLPEDKRERIDGDAYILVVRGGASFLSGEENESFADILFEEQCALPKDTKAKMYGRVVNKHARHNLCFADDPQDPDYENGKGRIIPFSDVPHMAQLRRMLPECLGPMAADLAVEGNYYFNTRDCGIGYHGDSERRKVIGVRLGASIPLCYAWFERGEVVSKDSTTKVQLHHGDMYVMSEKATGQDWKTRTKLTLRHAAGCEKFIKLPTPKTIRNR